jgi:Ca-activated chloride channel homolog
MKNNIPNITAKIISLLIINLSLLLILTACTDEGYQLVEEGNEQLINKNTSEAKTKYQQAQEQVKDSEAIEYNLAQTSYLEGQLEDAVKSFEKLTNSESDNIRNKSTAGLGNVYMKMADSTATQQPQQAYQLYTKSIEKYREVLNRLKEQIEQLKKQNTETEQKALTKSQLEELLGEDSLLNKVSYNLERAIKKRDELELPENQEQKKNQENQDNQEQKQNQDEQQQQNQDNQEQNQNQDNQQQQNQNQEQNQEQKDADKPLTAQEAKEMLEKMRNENEEIEEQMKQIIQQGKGIAVEKDW